MPQVFNLFNASTINSGTVNTDELMRKRYYIVGQVSTAILFVNFFSLRIVSLRSLAGP